MLFTAESCSLNVQGLFQAGVGKHWHSATWAARMRIKYLTKMIISLLFPILLAHCTYSLRPSLDQAHNISVHFTYIDAKATSVCLSGNFNQWSYQSHCLRRDGSSWSITVPLFPGRYQYGFIIDGNDWQPDPGSTLSEESGFGQINSVLIVE
jgi:1,4-alpha-glucan branching enzyme